jgi:hypothetical protein
MKLTALLALCCGVAAAQQPPSERADPKEWVAIFNGKNLDGWTAKIAHHEVGDNFGDTFRVKNGLVEVSYDKYPEFGTRFGHLFWKDKLSYYIVRVEYRFVGQQMKDGPSYARLNSGVMIHSQAPQTILKEQDWPISVEAQLIGNPDTGSRPTLNVCTPGTDIYMKGEMVKAHCVNSTSKAYHNDEWVTAEVEVLGGEKVRHWIDNKVVLEYEKPSIGGGVATGYDPAIKQDGKLLTEGYIALQSESQPVEFRRVELLNLSGCMDPKNKNFKPYYVHRDDSRCAR